MEEVAEELLKRWEKAAEDLQTTFAHGSIILNQIGAQDLDEAGPSFQFWREAFLELPSIQKDQEVQRLILDKMLNQEHQSAYRVSQIAMKLFINSLRSRWCSLQRQDPYWPLIIVAAGPIEAFRRFIQNTLADHDKDWEEELKKADSWERTMIKIGKKN